MKHKLKDLPAYLQTAIMTYAVELCKSWEVCYRDTSTEEHDLVDACFRFRSESSTDSLWKSPETAPVRKSYAYEEDIAPFLAYGNYVKGGEPFCGECTSELHNDNTPFFISTERNAILSETGNHYEARLNIKGWMPMPEIPKPQKEKQ